MAQRIIVILGLAGYGAALAQLALHAIQDPQAVRREQLAADLRDLPIGGEPWELEPAPFAKWQAAIAERPALWTYLVEPPPPPAPPPPPPPTPPNIAEKLQNVKAMRAQIGNKVQLEVDGRREFVPVGTIVNGCTLREFDRTKVVFSYIWSEGPNGPEELLHTIERQ